MGVRTYDLTKNPIVRGASWKFVCNYLQPDGETPIDLDGATARMRVKRSGDDELTWDATIDTETGAITTLRTAEQTAALNFTRAVYFLDVLFDSEPRTILTGAIPTI